MAHSASKIAAALGLSERRVQTLFNQGLPRTIPEAVAWYSARKIEREAKRSKTLDAARQRKTEAEAELAELELAKARGELVSVAEVTEEVGRVMDRLRVAILSVPGKWTPQMVGVPDMTTASSLMNSLSSELLEAMSGDDGE